MNVWRYRILTGIGLGLFVGFLAGMVKAWMIGESNATARWIAVGIALACAFGSHFVLGWAKQERQK